MSGFFFFFFKFFGITIYHALCNSDDCIFDINKVKAKGKFPKDKKKIVEAWAIIHQKELFECWDLLCKENKVIEIEPLK